MIHFVLCCILVNTGILFVLLYRWRVLIFTYSGEVYRLLLEPEDINIDITLVNFYGYATNRSARGPQMHFATFAVPLMTLNISSFTNILYFLCMFVLAVWKPVSHYNSPPLLLPAPNISMLRTITTHKNVRIVTQTNMCPICLYLCLFSLVHVWIVNIALKYHSATSKLEQYILHLRCCSKYSVFQKELPDFK